MCLRLEKNKKSFGSVGVFPPTEPMHLISTLSYEQDTLQSVGELVDSPNFYKWKFWTCQTRIKLKTKMGLVEEGEITTRGATTRILIFSANQGA